MLVVSWPTDGDPTAVVPLDPRFDHHLVVESIPPGLFLEGYPRDAVRLAAMSREERLARELDRD